MCALAGSYMSIAYAPMWQENMVAGRGWIALALVVFATWKPGRALLGAYIFGSVSILQMNLGRAGGILEAKKIAGLAETHYAHIAPHLYCGPIVGAANIQISTCSPNFLILEGIKDWKGFYSEIIKDPIEWKDGYVVPPKKPGLGVELKEEIIDKYKYSGTKLHLEMASI